MGAEVSVVDLLVIIGDLTVENRKLKYRIAALEQEMQAKNDDKGAAEV